MTKVKKIPERSGSRHHKTNLYSLRAFHPKITKDSHHKNRKASEKKEWRDARCSVCMEYPHNAVLLLCSSHHKGCRSYMCATSCRYSNCLDQYKKAYTKVNPAQAVVDLGLSSGSDELLCPLCRGQVKGWTVVKQARKFFNSKKRNCMQDNCSYVGSYKDLRKHVRANHPSARPREVDPSLAKKWKKLENDRELNDVMSTITSTMPGSVVVGDYVIERNYHDMDDVIFQLESRNMSRNFRRDHTMFRRGYRWSDDDDDDEDHLFRPINVDDDDESEDGIEEHLHDYMVESSRHRPHGRVLYGGSRSDYISRSSRHHRPHGRVLYGGSRSDYISRSSRLGRALYGGSGRRA